VKWVIVSIFKVVSFQSDYFSGEANFEIVVKFQRYLFYRDTVFRDLIEACIWQLGILGIGFLGL